MGSWYQTQEVQYLDPLQEHHMNPSLFLLLSLKRMLPHLIPHLVLFL